MPRSVEYFINDMLQAARKALAKSRQAELELAMDSEDLQELILWNIMVLGEASTHIPPAIKQEWSGINWTRVKILRNMVTHVYFGLDWSVMDRVSKTFLPKLITELEKMASKYPLPEADESEKQ